MDVKFVDCFHQPCPQRIEMNVANQFKQVSVFLADNPFVAVLQFGFASAEGIRAQNNRGLPCALRLFTAV